MDTDLGFTIGVLDAVDPKLITGGPMEPLDCYMWSH